MLLLIFLDENKVPFTTSGKWARNCVFELNGHEDCWDRTSIDVMKSYSTYSEKRTVYSKCPRDRALGAAVVKEDSKEEAKISNRKSMFPLATVVEGLDHNFD